VIAAAPAFPSEGQITTGTPFLLKSIQERRSRPTTPLYPGYICVSRRQRKMYCGHVRLCLSVCMSVCLSVAVHPHYCTDPDVTWGRGRGCPLVVHYWAGLQSVHGLRCYGNITRNLMRGVRALLISDRQVLMAAFSKLRAVYCKCAWHRGWLAGDWPSTGGILHITAAAWTAGFHWWRSGDITRTQNTRSMPSQTS